MIGTSRLRIAARLFVSAGLVATCALPLAAPTQAQTAGTWKVQAGGSGEAPNQDLALFLPSRLTVRVGDTVNFVLNQPGAPHTVTFLSGAQTPDLFVPVPGGPTGALRINPVAVIRTPETSYEGTGIRNSGVMGLDPGTPTSYSLTFTRAGSYQYVCLLHPLMIGNVTVGDTGATLPATTQAAVDAQAQQEAQAGRTELTNLARAQASSYPQGASPSWRFGIDVPSRLGTVTSYFPATSQIRVGDTVQWTNNSPFEIHSVTFLAGGQLPPLILPDGSLNPAAGAPSGGPMNNGGANNSGILGPGANYSLTFTRAGSYPYICVVHEELHTGVITVVDGAVAPGNPISPSQGQPGSAPSFGQPGGTPGQGVPGGAPGQGQPGGAPGQGGQPGGIPGQGGQPGGTPGQGQPGGTPSFGQPGGAPSQGQPGGTPSFGQPGGTPGQGQQPGGTPGQGQPGATPGQGQPGGTPGQGQPGGTTPSGQQGSAQAIQAAIDTLRGLLGSVGGTPGQGQPGGTPGQALPGGTPGQGQSGGTPGQGQPGGTPGQQGGTPSSGQSGQ